MAKKCGCRNCKNGAVIRGTGSFPDVYCRLSKADGWDAVRSFGDCCDKHEWRFNSNVCPNCGGRATKILRLNDVKQYLCQQCGYEYARP